MENNLKLDLSSNVSIFQQIVNVVEARIITQELMAEDFLPSVRETALANLINPNTVAKAYQELQRMGLVKSVRGKGLKVCNANPEVWESRKWEILEKKIHDLLRTAEKLKISKSDLLNMIKELK